MLHIIDLFYRVHCYHLSDSRKRIDERFTPFIKISRHSRQEWLMTLIFTRASHEKHTIILLKGILWYWMPQESYFRMISFILSFWLNSLIFPRRDISRRESVRALMIQICYWSRQRTLPLFFDYTISLYAISHFSRLSYINLRAPTSINYLPATLQKASCFRMLVFPNTHTYIPPLSIAAW